MSKEHFQGMAINLQPLQHITSLKQIKIWHSNSQMRILKQAY